MKKIWKMDAKEVLPSVLCLAAAFLLLEITFLTGVAVNNYKLVSTCLTMAVWVLVVTVAWIAGRAGSLFLTSLRMKSPYDDLARDGISVTKAVLFRIGYNGLLLIGFVSLYVAALFADIRILAARFPQEKDALAQFRLKNILNADGASVPAAFVTTVLEYMTLLMVLLVLVYLAVAIAYAYTMRNRFTGIGAFLLYLFLLGAFYRLYRVAVGQSKGVAMHLRAAGLQAAVAVLLTFLTIVILRTQVFGGEKKKRPGEV